MVYMVRLQQNLECKICARNGKPGVNVDIEWLDEINPNTGKNRNRYYQPYSREQHFHHEKPGSSYDRSTRPNDVPRLERSEEVAHLYKRLKDAEVEIRNIRVSLDNLAF